jgi:hypothetical protein
MKPQAIRWFDGLFLGSMVASAVDAVIQWPATMAELDGDLAVIGSGAGVAIAIATLVIGYGLYLLLWYGISMKGSRVAKWILVAVAVLTLLGAGALFFLPDELANAGALLAHSALLTAATVALFLPGAADWFRPNQISPTTFE